MMGARVQCKPAFPLQAVLILLPVAVLAVLGWLSVRQDRIFARYEAVQRAQTLADDLVLKIWPVLAGLGGGPEVAARLPLLDGAHRPPMLPANAPVSVRVNGAGELVFPVPCPGWPVPQALDPAELSSNQALLWREMQPASPAGEPAAAIAGYRRFLDLRPPERFAAEAHYGLGLLLLQSGDRPGACNEWKWLANSYPDAVGETGLPLRPLAELKLLQNAVFSSPALLQIAVERFASNVVSHPSPLTPVLLQQAESLNPAAVSVWRRIWEQHERDRRFYAVLKGHFYTGGNSVLQLPFESMIEGSNSAPGMASFAAAEVASARPLTPRWFWFEAPSEDESSAGAWHWLANRIDEGTNTYRLACHSEAEIGMLLDSTLKVGKQIPEYFGISVDLLGRRVPLSASDLHVWHPVSWFSDHSPGGGTRKEYTTDQAEILTSGVRSENGLEQLKVSVYLTSPTTLFQRQRARAFWFGGTIVASTVVALTGLLMAWRAFDSQRRLSESKSNFVASVSHELRAPIASVRLMAESLERGKIQDLEKQGLYHRYIIQECRRLSSLVENVLDFSRIEQGRKEYEFESTDLVALVQQTAALLEPYASEKGVCLKSNNLQLSTFNLQPLVDGRAIQQALVNLIDNAVKHSPKGATVTIGLEIPGSKPESGPATFNLQPSTFNLYVEDAGPGIPVEEQKKIFERFYRRGSELRRETQGVGIGLSLVKHVVEAHCGRITVRSAPGEGSRFTMELPMNNDRGGAETGRGDAATKLESAGRDG